MPPYTGTRFLSICRHISIHIYTLSVLFIVSPETCSPNFSHQTFLAKVYLLWVIFSLHERVANGDLEGAEAAGYSRQDLEEVAPIVMS